MSYIKFLCVTAVEQIKLALEELKGLGFNYTCGKTVPFFDCPLNEIIFIWTGSHLWNNVM